MATEWKKVDYRHLRATVAMDNYEPARDEWSIPLLEYDTEHVTNGIKVPAPHPWVSKKPNSLVFIIDDGKTAVPYYVAGWRYRADWQRSEEEWNELPDPKEYLILHPFPVNPDGRTRPDNGRVADFTGWGLGPRTAYHLKVNRPEEPA